MVLSTGEWMFRRNLLDKIPFNGRFSYTEILYGFCDDYIYGSKLLSNNIKACATHKPTLRYYLGGNSQEAKQ